MKIAIIHPCDGCDEITASAPAILLQQYARHSRFRDSICVFSNWTQNPFRNLNTQLLPKNTPIFVAHEAPL